MHSYRLDEQGVKNTMMHINWLSFEIFAGRNKRYFQTLKLDFDTKLWA